MRYFVIEYNKKHSQDAEIMKIHQFCTEKQLFEFLQSKENSAISIYKAECVLDWS